MFSRRTLRSYLKTGLFACGIDLKRLSYLDNPHYRLAEILRSKRICTIFDVGANAGQYALVLREIGYRGKIISFEPLLSAYKDLLQCSSQDKNWIVHPRSAISDHDGIQLINVSQNSVSSSLHDQLPIHLTSAPQSQVVGQEAVNVCTFDSVFAYYNKILPGIKNNCLLKIDAQGHEFTILENCSSLSKMAVLMLEVSVEPMYEGEKTIHYICEWLSSKGFDLWSLTPTFADISTGRIMQYDGIYVNSILAQV